MKYFENDYKICKLKNCSMFTKNIFCCNIHSILYEEEQIEILKKEGRYKNDYS